MGSDLEPRKDPNTLLRSGVATESRRLTPVRRSGYNRARLCGEGLPIEQLIGELATRADTDAAQRAHRFQRETRTRRLIEAEVSRGRRRVVISGLGAIASLGRDVESIWRSVLAGESGAAPITAFDARDQLVRIACEARDFDAAEWIDGRGRRRMPRYVQLAVAAAQMATSDAKLDIASERERVGVALGTAHGGLGSIEHSTETLRLLGLRKLPPLAVTSMIPSMNAGWVSMELGARGPACCTSTACAASTMAVGEARDLIMLGRADVMLAGGSEAPVTPLAVAGYTALRALSRRNEDPRAASRPFDSGRDGFVIGEGAAVLVLEDLEHAKNRGARIYCELVGYGCCADAYHVTDPDPSGHGTARAMALALSDAQVSPGDVGYVNAHATATRLGDAREAQAISLALGPETATTTPVSSTKGALGHCLGASGAIEAALTVLALQRDVVPATLNLDDPDPDCQLDHVANVAREMQVEIALTNNLGFGGHNACLALRKFHD
jgi:3-oxoacyl-[acyl-carrier-protein] synthase II